MTPVLRAYLLIATAPAAAAMLVMLALPAASPDLALLALLVGLGILAAGFPVMVSPRYKVDATPAVYLACVLLFAPAIAVTAIGLSRLLGDGALCVRRRRQPIDVVFNTSQLVLAAAAGAVIMHSIPSPLGVIGAGTAMYVVSTALVVFAAGLQTHRDPFQVWAEAAGADLKQTAALYVAGYLLTVVASGRPWLAAAMMIPVAGIQLSLQRSLQLMGQTIAAVESMADVVDRRDPYTFQHSQSVAEHAVRIARQLRLADAEVELIRLAARVHDLGKIEVPDEVLHKQGRLSAEEFELMKKHPRTGAEILAKFPEYRRGRELVLSHHERLDGLGYPRGLAGDGIQLGARIIAVADSWDAMTSDRPYRKALEGEVALGELMRGRGTQWDPRVVDAFAETLPGAHPSPEHQWYEAGRPLLRSLGAAVGILAG
jgi:putative nucleotidyltransferase with HDIG domain